MLKDRNNNRNIMVGRPLGFPIRAFLMLALALSMSACRQVPVVDIDDGKGDTLGEHLINANRIHARGEDNQIENYVSRRGWQTAQLGGGARVALVEKGAEPVVSGDTVAICYHVETLGGEVIYDNASDTVVAGRIGRTRGYAPQGLDAALRSLSYGSKAWVILPSEQAYGVVGDGDRIGSRTVLVYRIDKIEKIITTTIQQ